MSALQTFGVGYDVTYVMCMRSIAHDVVTLHRFVRGVSPW
jgi:hypothetical protein